MKFAIGQKVKITNTKLNGTNYPLYGPIGKIITIKATQELNHPECQNWYFAKGDRKQYAEVWLEAVYSNFDNELDEYLNKKITVEEFSQRLEYSVTYEK